MALSWTDADYAILSEPEFQAAESKGRVVLARTQNEAVAAARAMVTPGTRVRIFALAGTATAALNITITPVTPGTEP